MEPPRNNRIIVPTVPVEEAEQFECYPVLRQNEKGKEAKGVYLLGSLGLHRHCEISEVSVVTDIFSPYICFAE